MAVYLNRGITLCIMMVAFVLILLGFENLRERDMSWARTPVDKKALFWQDVARQQVDYCKNAYPLVREAMLDNPKFELAEPLLPNESAGGATFKLWIYSEGDGVSTAVKTEGGFEREEVRDFIIQLKKAEETRKKLDRTVSGKGRLLDVGANIGVWSIPMAILGHPVVAAEPMASNLLVLRSTVCENLEKFPDLLTNHIIVPMGLGDRTETCWVQSSVHNRGDGSLHCTQGDIEPFNQNTKVLGKTKVVKLDDIWPPPVDLVVDGLQFASFGAEAVKMDTEGFEMLNTLGAKNTFFTRPKAHSGVSFHHPQFVMAEYQPGMMQQRNQGHNVVLGELDYIKLWVDAGFKIHKDAFHGPVETPQDVMRRSAERQKGGIYLNMYLIRELEE